MKTFETFIESEAFFPVLILLLVLLVCVFMWIVMSNKNDKRKRREKKNIKIDENAKIKIVSNGDEEVRVKKTKKQTNDEEPGRNEIAIVEEVKSVDPVYDFKPKKEVFLDKFVPMKEDEQKKEIKEEYEIIDYRNIDYGDLSVPPTPDIFKNETTVEDPLSLIQDKEEQIFPEEIKEQEVPNSTVSNSLNKAFNSTPSDDRIVHEDIKVEDEPKEYTSEKTEVFDFPDFDQEDIFSSGDIETEIINAAEDYIKKIMNNK